MTAINGCLLFRPAQRASFDPDRPVALGKSWHSTLRWPERRRCLLLDQLVKEQSDLPLMLALWTWVSLRSWCTSANQPCLPTPPAIRRKLQWESLRVRLYRVPCWIFDSKWRAIQPRRVATSRHHHLSAQVRLQIGRLPTYPFTEAIQLATQAEVDLP